MSLTPRDWTIGLPASALVSEPALAPTELEREIIALFDEFRSPLMRYAFTFGLPAGEAEEVVQEVFLALFQHLRKGRSRRNLRGWIFRVAHNLALKQCYANRRKQYRIEPEEARLAARLAPTLSPEDEMATAQRTQRLQSILRALPPQDQRCLYLRAEGMRYREIAEVLDMSLGAVSISLTKSLGRFRRAEQGDAP